MKLKDSEVFTEETADRPRQMERAKEFLWSSNYLLSGFYIRFAEKKRMFFFFQSDVSSWKIKLLENRQKSIKNSTYIHPELFSTECLVKNTQVKVKLKNI